MLIALSARRITEVGLLAGGLGGLIIAWGAIQFVREAVTREAERTLTLIGALLIALGFGLQLFAMVTGSKGTPAPPVSPVPFSSPSPSVSTSPAPTA